MTFYCHSLIFFNVLVVDLKKKTEKKFEKTKSSEKIRMKSLIISTLAISMHTVQNCTELATVPDTKKIFFFWKNYMKTNHYTWMVRFFLLVFPFLLFLLLPLFWSLVFFSTRLGYSYVVVNRREKRHLENIWGKNVIDSMQVNWTEHEP